MGLLERLFGPATKPSPTEPEVRDGHVHGPDAAPDDVVLPKTKRSSRSGLAGKPPAGWKRQVTENSGGVWPWSGGSGDGGHYSGGSGGDGGGGGGS
ncbi:MAG: hypothetical protein AVDCRST_MAG53-2265 [uncultured Solirubrobacteraceae bacterium]|uniref:Uncharacterized protein n=1 Tax=uncultured Solirubrobacteraceae bacterium TaxID=1162706 RepID=A0A6J4SMY1_9ACTN|nr:MAG: hypothetical protein AVDCRST_MAG53-2265 [uncultured Solirubrobacteraceae bacterium]